MSATIRLMKPDDLGFADILRAEAGWNQTTEDWENLICFEETDCFIAEWFGEPAGTISALHYTQSLSWIGMLLVKDSFQGNGIGKALFQSALRSAAQRQIRAVGLDATPAGRPIYLKHGFSTTAQLHRWEGTVHHQESEALPTITDEDWGEICELDAVSFGCYRESFLRRLASRSRTAVFRSQGRVSGYGLLRPGQRAWQLGPIIASDRATAERIAGSLLASINGEMVYWDAFSFPAEVTPPLPSAFGLTIQRPFERMILNGPFHQKHHKIFAISDPSTG